MHEPIRFRLRSLVITTPIVVALASLAGVYVYSRLESFRGVALGAFAFVPLVCPVFGYIAARSLGVAKTVQEISVIAGALLGMTLFTAGLLFYLLRFTV